MNKIEKCLVDGVNPIAELLGTERTEDLKDKIAQMILERVENDLNDAFDQAYLVDPEKVTDFGNEVFEEIKEEIRQKLKAKYMAIAEEAISKVRVED